MTTAILVNSGLLLLGLLMLYFGGNYLVKGAGGLALRFKIPPIVIGLTVVAFGTSAPEFFVSLISALQGFTEISLGNVVGSNTINVALILGLSAMIITIPVSRGIIRRDIPLMFASYALLLLLTLPLGFENLPPETGRVSRIEGVILIIALAAYVIFLYRYSRAHQEEVAELVEMDALDEKEATRPLWLMLLEIAGGIAALGFGSDFLIDGASWLARNIFGASDRFIGITIVAFGTSLPELVTSVIAAAKKQMDISVGNIVGSNIFNTLMVIGATAIASPLLVSMTGFTVDLLVMLGASLLLYLVALVFRKLNRLSGIVFLVGYGLYFLYLLQGRAG